MAGGGLGGLGGAIGGIIGQLTAGPGGFPQFKEIVALMRKLKDPSFNMRELSAPELQLLGQMVPQVYDAIVPQEAALAQETPGAREAQMGSLQSLQDIQNQGLPLHDRLAAQNAQNAILQTNRQANLGLQQNLAQRGRLSAGNQIQANVLANQGTTNLAAQMGNDLISQSLGRRMGAAQAAGGLAGQIRGQDFNRSAYNADAVNRFNQYVSGQRSAAAEYGAGARERAQGYNVGTTQDIGNVNIMSKYQNQLRNQEYLNNLRDLASQRERQRVGMLGSALGGLGTAREARRAEYIANARSYGEGIGGAVGGIGGGGLLGGILG